MATNHRERDQHLRMASGWLNRCASKGQRTAQPQTAQLLPKWLSPNTRVQYTPDTASDRAGHHHYLAITALNPVLVVSAVLPMVMGKHISIGPLFKAARGPGFRVGDALWGRNLRSTCPCPCGR